MTDFAKMDFPVMGQDFSEIIDHAIGVDTEYHTGDNHRIDRVYCVAATDKYGRQYKKWLNPNEDHSGILQEIAAFFGYDYPIFTCHAYAYAEFQAFTFLKAHPEQFRWFDTCFFTRLLSNAFASKKDKKKDDATSDSTGLSYSDMCLFYLHKKIDTDHKEAMRKLCIDNETSGNEQQILDYCADDTQWLIPAMRKMLEEYVQKWAKFIGITPRKNAGLPNASHPERVMRLMDSVRAFTQIASRGIPVSIERLDACRKGAVRMSDEYVQRFLASYPDAYVLDKPSTKTLDKCVSEADQKRLLEMPRDEATDELFRLVIASKSERTANTARNQFEVLYDATGARWKQNRAKCLAYLEVCLRERGALERWAKSEKTGQLSLASDDLKDEFRKESGCFGADYYYLQKKLTSLNGISGRGKSDWFANLDRDASLMRYGSLHPMATVTGRCAAKPTEGFVFLWWKGLYCALEPPKGKWLVELDYSSEETYIQAQVFQDPAYNEAYHSKDIYLYMGEGIGLIPKEDFDTLPVSELKEKYGAERKKLKTYTLASSYGAGIAKLSSKLGMPPEDVQGMRDKINRKFCCYAYNRQQLAQKIDPKSPRPYLGINLEDGWLASCTKDGESGRILSMLNYPIQGTGSSILRRLVCELEKRGIETFATIHDAVFFMVDEGDYATIERVSKLMKVVADHILATPEGADGMRVGEPEIVKHGEIWTPEHAYDEDAKEVLRAGGYAC